MCHKKRRDKERRRERISVETEKRMNNKEEDEQT